MQFPLKNLTLLSAVALLAIGSADVATAQYKKPTQDCIDPQDCPTQQMQKSDQEEQESSTRRRKKLDESDSQEQATDEQPRRKRRIQEDLSEGEGQLPDEQFVKRRPSAQAQTEWKFDPQRHQRRRKRDDRFRHQFGEHWYDEPYWRFDYGYARPYRISCSEGRLILLDRGFRRVRTLECGGRVYSYLARRYGDTFRILVNARTGRILRVRPV